MSKTLRTIEKHTYVCQVRQKQPQGYFHTIAHPACVNYLLRVIYYLPVWHNANALAIRTKKYLRNLQLEDKLFLNIGTVRCDICSMHAVSICVYHAHNLNEGSSLYIC